MSVKGLIEYLLVLAIVLTIVYLIRSCNTYDDMLIAAHLNNTKNKYSNVD